MITPLPNQELPTHKHSHNQIRFECECGNIFSTEWNSFSNNRTKSCGECKIFKWKSSGRTKFEKLQLITPISEVKRLTDKLPFQCECGVIKNIRFVGVLNGHTNSCGCIRKQAISDGVQNSRKFDQRSMEYWISEIPSLINKDLPESWSAGSSKYFNFQCRCGKIFERKFCKFNSKSNCGRCSEVSVKKGQIINGFIYDDEPVLINSNSNSKLYFVCKCGRRELERIRIIFGGIKETCYKCSLFSAEELSKQKFGKLRIKNPVSVKKNSGLRLEWVCDCGNEVNIAFYSVFSSGTRSCGRCKEKIDNWYIANKSALKSVRFPLSKYDELIRVFQPECDLENAYKTFKAVCPVCSEDYYPKFVYIRKGESLTCGCTSGRTSLAQNEIASFIKTLGKEAILEYAVHNMKYDVFVPEKNLLIEYHGLKWHALPESRIRDKKKYEYATDNKYEFLCIFEDEWRYKRQRVENLLKNRLGSNQPRSVRPSKCETKKIHVSEADEFYESHHYIGKCKSQMNYGAFFEGKLVSLASFKRPTRQSSHSFELVRMASDPNYRVHGIWSKLVQSFIEEYRPSSIVSFSDNRLFQGNVYEKIGFSYDGSIPPDYYWVKDKKRHHKSGLRKPKGEIRTEVQIRTEQGFKRIWDLGKKRWVMRIGHKFPPQINTMQDAMGEVEAIS